MRLREKGWRGDNNTKDYDELKLESIRRKDIEKKKPQGEKKGEKGRAPSDSYQGTLS